MISRFCSASAKLLSNNVKYSNLFSNNARKLSLTQPDLAKVTLIGAGGAIGQSLALLLKFNPLITNLTLQDIKNTNGIAADLSHIDTSTQVFSYHGPGSVAQSVEGADVIIIAAGMPRKPGMTRDDLFTVNADIVWDIMTEITYKHPAKIVVVTNPINSIIPVVTNFMRQSGSPLFEKRLFGVTTLDSVRASYYYAKYLDKDPREVHVPVVGGHSGTTIVPLFSMSNIPLLDEAVSAKLTELVQQGGDYVVKEKAGTGSASLSMAYAANRFVNSLLEAFYGKKSYECAFVSSTSHTDIEYFAEMLELVHDGVKDHLNQTKLTPYEHARLESIIPQLKADIKKGVDFAYKKNPALIKLGEALITKRIF